MTKRKIEYWVIPPEQDAEFVACMEEVLETYAEAYDPRYPVLCMDEQPVQLLKGDSCKSRSRRRRSMASVSDYEYERNGTASISHVRGAAVGISANDGSATTDPKVDWALEVAHMLDTRLCRL